MYVLGIDIGTTGTKSMLIDRDGKIISSAYKGYQLIKPGINIVEQSADDWWHAVVYTIRECIKDFQKKSDIISISISAQGGCLLNVDAHGEPITNAVSWMDTRSIEQQHQMLSTYDDNFFYQKTGWRLSPSMNLCKIKWLKDTKDVKLDQTFKLLSTIDYINYKLTGIYAIDPSSAAMTQLMNIQRNKWDEDLLDMIELKADMLPEIVKSGEVIGSLTKEASALLGLDTAVKVISGGHDQYCAAIGCGAVNSGEIFLSTGTAWVILGVTEKPLFDRRSYIAPGPHIINGLWGALASIYSAGVSMEWFRNNFALEKKVGENYEIESYKEIDQKASTTMERTKGLLFYPYFNGSGFPDRNYKAKASLIGLGLEHSRYDIARAVMESAAFNVKYSMEKYREAGCEPKNLKVFGGASRSSLWMDIISNVLDMNVVKLNEADAACMGAAVVAGTGCGMFSDYAQGYEMVSSGETLIEKDNEKVKWYEGKYLSFIESMKHLGSLYNSVF